MNIAAATDFIESTGAGSAELAMRRLAESGFTHLHWCHQWNTDFMYSTGEIGEYRKCLQEYGLKLLDIHGSAGCEKVWFSPVEYQRRAGVELVANRIQMLRELAGEGALMMHIPCFRTNTQDQDKPSIRREVDALKKSLDELLPVMEKFQVPIALENMWGDTWEILEEIFAAYDPKWIGLCYDSGHANSNVYKQLEHLEKNRDRLMALHLHGNDGNSDQHRPPFMAGDTVDWERLTGLIADSAYKGMASFELSIRNTPFFVPDVNSQPEENCRKFLQFAYENCLRVAGMIEASRQKV